MKLLIRNRFDTALETRALFWTRTELNMIQQQGISFQILLVKILEQKPTSQPKTNTCNPFLPPDPQLLVTEFHLHNVLFNKFCVSRDHLLLTTKTFESQYSCLNRFDFEAAWRIIKELYNETLLFYYNCGTHSGASIKHKHVQMLRCNEHGIPIHEIISSYSVDEWTPFLLQEYSFVHACAKISHGDETQLEKMLEVLIRFAFQKANLDPQKALQVSKQCEQEPDGFVSYNVLFTKEWILVVPRKLETFGPISINSVGFAGMMLAKSKSDFEFIQSQNPLTILKQLTF